MGKPILLMRLEGPLQSWGVRARWDVRDTQPEPTKSGIIGLLGCALGYPMNDPRLETELDAGLRFGVRVESPGRVIEDYQTISGFLPTAEGTFKHSGVKTAVSLAKLRSDPDVTPSTIISPRYYLEDAAFLVALEEKNGHAGLLRRCADALERPVWPIYLGRKACIPTRPVLEVFTQEYDDIKDALRRHEWSWLRSCKIKRDEKLPDQLDAYAENEDGPFVRQDAVRINPARSYGFRHASHFKVQLTKEMIDGVSIQAGA